MEKFTWMSPRKKMISLVVLVVVGTLAIVWGYRTTLIIKILGFAQRAAFSVVPNQPIQWQGGVWQGEGRRPPNIIVILVDDMGFNDVSFHGGGLIETPNIDRLASEGVRFANGYAGSAVCAPSRAMLLTGRYSTRFGFEFTPTPDMMGSVLAQLSKNDPMPRTFRFVEHTEENQKKKSALPFRSRGMPTEEVTLAEELGDAGYHTVHIGKWHLGRDEKLLPNAQGFEESLLMESGLYLPVDSPDVVNARNDYAILDRVQWEILTYAASFNGGPRFEPKGYLTDYYTDEALKAIEANKDRPFFLYLAHWGVHTPLQASRADFEAVGDHFATHRARVYAAMLRAVDRSIGRVLQALKDHGLDENTLVIFTSDNGGANYIGMPDINKPYRGWKLSFFEGGTHVPFVMRWPERLPSGITYPHPVSHLDIMPTALGAVGKRPRVKTIDGVNLLPYLTGQKDGMPRDTLIFREGPYQAIIASGWKMQRAREPVAFRLFHLAEDPYELKDLSAARPDKIGELSAMLDRHNAGQAASMWPSAVEIPVWIDKSLADNPTLEDDYILWPN